LIDCEIQAENARASVNTNRENHYQLGAVEMLSDIAVKQLSALTFRSESKRLVNILPFGSIYWADEMPDVQQFILCPEQDRTNILRMFSTRIKLWDAEALSDEEINLWNSIHSQVPNWALFQRLTLNDEDRLAREEAKRQVEREFESL
jgi:hypothetical protein